MGSHGIHILVLTALGMAELIQSDIVAMNTARGTRRNSRSKHSRIRISVMACVSPRAEDMSTQKISTKLCVQMLQHFMQSQQTQRHDQSSNPSIKSSPTQ